MWVVLIARMEEQGSCCQGLLSQLTFINPTNRGQHMATCGAAAAAPHEQSIGQLTHIMMHTVQKLLPSSYGYLFSAY